MRRFLVLGHKTPLTGEFSLNDLPGSAGRIDVLCRAIGASLFLSHGVRRDTEVILLLQNELQVRIVGSRVKRLNPDERSTAALIQHAIRAVEADEVETTPGIFASHSTLAQSLDRLYQLEAHPIVLHEDGLPIDSFSFPENPAFILSDHVDFADEEMETLTDLPLISLGSQILHTSQCITILNYLLDRGQEDSEGDLVLCHKVWGEPKAQLISGLLEDFEIPVNLVRHSPPSLYPVAVDGLAEVRLMVRPRDLSRARAIIADYFEAPVED